MTAGRNAVLFWSAVVATMVVMVVVAFPVLRWLCCPSRLSALFGGGIHYFLQQLLLLRQQQVRQKCVAEREAVGGRVNNVPGTDYRGGGMLGWCREKMISVSICGRYVSWSGEGGGWRGAVGLLSASAQQSAWRGVLAKVEIITPTKSY